MNFKEITKSLGVFGSSGLFLGGILDLFSNARSLIDYKTALTLSLGFIILYFFVNFFLRKFDLPLNDKNDGFLVRKLGKYYEHRFMIVLSILLTFGAFDYFDNTLPPFKINERRIFPFKLGDSSEVAFIFGSTSFELAKEEIKEGVNPVKFIGCKNGSNPIEIFLKDGKIMIDAIFYDLDDKVVGEIDNNEWQSNQNNLFKINYDDTAIEVIDQYNVVALQLQFKDDTIILKGAFHCLDDLIMSGDNYFTHLQKRLPIKAQQEGFSLKNEYLKHGRAITRIFDYTGKDYLGKRINE